MAEFSAQHGNSRADRKQWEHCMTIEGLTVGDKKMLMYVRCDDYPLQWCLTFVLVALLLKMEIDWLTRHTQCAGKRKGHRKDVEVLRSTVTMDRFWKFIRCNKTPQSYEKQWQVPECCTVWNDSGKFSNRLAGIVGSVCVSMCVAINLITAIKKCFIARLLSKVDV